MGRFRVQSVYDEDDDEDNDAMHIQQENEDEVSGIWKGALIQMTHHCPQNPSHENINNGMDVPSPRSEGTMTFTPPSVSIRRPRRPWDNSDDSGDNSQAVAFHPTNYHYQYDYPPPPKPWLSWRNIIMFAVMAHLVARYGPAAPPPAADSESWEDFWVRELRGLWRTTKLVGYTVPKYVTEWVVVGLWDDAQYYYERYQSYNSVQKELEFWSNCSLQIPTHSDNDDDWNLEYTVTDISMDQIDPNNKYYQIVGQSRAIQTTTQALDAWAQSSPLLLYFAGSRGVGKLELARQIGQRLFGHCEQKDNDGRGEDDENSSTDDGRISETPHDLFSSVGSPVLLLHGRDFSARLALEDTTYDAGEILEILSDEADESAQTRRTMDSATAAKPHAGVSTRTFRLELYETLLRHTQQHPNGTVVILQHAEEAVEGLIVSLVHDLTNPSRHVSTLDRANNYPNAGDDGQPQQSLASRLQKACRKTVFILTSNIGSKTIASSIRSYGGISNIPPLELDLMLMHELDTHYSADQQNEGTSSSTQRRPSNVEVGSVRQFSSCSVCSFLEPWFSPCSTLPCRRPTEIPRSGTVLSLGAALDGEHIDTKGSPMGSSRITTPSWIYSVVLGRDAQRLECVARLLSC